MTPAQHKKNGPNREHRGGAGQIPFECQVRTSHHSRVLEMGKLCVPWLVRVLGFYNSRVLTSPCWIRSLFLLGVSLGIFYEILYIHDTWMASNPLSRSLVYTAPSALTPSASWRHQPLSDL